MAFRSGSCPPREEIRAGNAEGTGVITRQTSEEPQFSIRDALTDALRYWEPRRLIYNAALAVVVVIQVARAWPVSRQILTFDSILGLFILAVLANVAYCAAYIPDILIQQSALRSTWLKYRWTMLAVGCLFAAALTYFFTLGIIWPEGLPPGAI